MGIPSRLIPSPRLLAFGALVAIQVSISTFFKLSQIDSSYAYSPASSLALSEFVKLVVAGLLLAREVGLLEMRKQIRTASLSSFGVKVFGLSTLYAINNHFAFALFRVADPGSINLFKAGTSFISAILLRLVSNRLVSSVQWVAIIIQVIGLIQAQYDPCLHKATLETWIYWMIFAHVLIASINGLWNEKLVKQEHYGLHLQNVILYLCGFLWNLVFYAAIPPSFYGTAENQGFFSGYTFPALVVVFLNCIIGMAITAVYKYADVIVKTFAVAVSTAILFSFNWVLFQTWTPSLMPILGILAVFCATYIYMKTPLPALEKDGATTVRKRVFIGLIIVVGLGVAWNTSSIPKSSLVPARFELNISAPVSAPVFVEPPVDPPIDPPVDSRPKISAVDMWLSSPVYSNNRSIINDPTSCSWTSLCTECLSLPGCGWTGNECVAGNWNGPEDPEYFNTTWMWNTCNVDEVGQSYFNDILVIVYWNEVRENRIPHMIVWRRIFPNMLLVGAPRPTKKEFAEILPAPWFTCTEGSRWVQYICQARVMQAYPGYRGYLMLHWDLMFNYWNTILAKFDRDKFWLVPPGSYTCYDKGWNWWVWGIRGSRSNQFGLVDSVFPDLPPNTQKAINETARNPMNKTIPIDCGFSDILYVPSRFVGKFIYYSTLFYRHNVFLEIAVPTMMNWIVLHEHGDILHWERYLLGSNWDRTRDTVHSIQWTSADQQVMWHSYIWGNRNLTFPYAGIVRVPRVLDSFVPNIPIPEPPPK
jgi:UDP-sugar transporter A1/2/3